MTVVHALCETGHDVVAIAQVAKGSSDDELLWQAQGSACSLQSIALGELVYPCGRSFAGVILVRLWRSGTAVKQQLSLGQSPS